MATILPHGSNPSKPIEPTTAIPEEPSVPRLPFECIPHPLDKNSIQSTTLDEMQNTRGSEDRIPRTLKHDHPARFFKDPSDRRNQHHQRLSLFIALISALLSETFASLMISFVSKKTDLQSTPSNVKSKHIEMIPVGYISTSYSQILELIDSGTDTDSMLLRLIIEEEQLSGTDANSNSKINLLIKHGSGEQLLSELINSHNKEHAKLLIKDGVNGNSLLHELLQATINKSIDTKEKTTLKEKIELLIEVGVDADSLLLQLIFKEERTDEDKDKIKILTVCGAGIKFLERSLKHKDDNENNKGSVENLIKIGVEGDKLLLYLLQNKEENTNNISVLVKLGPGKKLILDLLAGEYNLDNETRQKYIKTLVENGIDIDLVYKDILSGNDEKQIKNLVKFGLAKKLMLDLFAEKFNLDEEPRQEYIRTLVRNGIDSNIIRQEILSGDDKNQIINLIDLNHVLCDSGTPISDRLDYLIDNLNNEYFEKLEATARQALYLEIEGLISMAYREDPFATQEKPLKLYKICMKLSLYHEAQSEVFKKHLSAAKIEKDTIREETIENRACRLQKIEESIVNTVDIIDFLNNFQRDLLYFIENQFEDETGTFFHIDSDEFIKQANHTFKITLIHKLKIEDTECDLKNQLIDVYNALELLKQQFKVKIHYKAFPNESSIFTRLNLLYQQFDLNLEKILEFLSSNPENEIAIKMKNAISFVSSLSISVDSDGGKKHLTDFLCQNGNRKERFRSWILSKILKKKTNYDEHKGERSKYYTCAQTAMTAYDLERRHGLKPGTIERYVHLHLKTNFFSTKGTNILVSKFYHLYGGQSACEISKSIITCLDFIKYIESSQEESNEDFASNIDKKIKEIDLSVDSSLLNLIRTTALKVHTSPSKRKDLIKVLVEKLITRANDYIIILHTLAHIATKDKSIEETPQYITKLQQIRLDINNAIRKLESNSNISKDLLNDLKHKSQALKEIILEKHAQHITNLCEIINSDMEQRMETINSRISGSILMSGAPCAGVIDAMNSSYSWVYRSLPSFFPEPADSADDLRSLNGNKIRLNRQDKAIKKIIQNIKKYFGEVVKIPSPDNLYQLYPQGKKILEPLRSEIEKIKTQINIMEGKIRDHGSEISVREGVPVMKTFIENNRKLVTNLEKLHTEFNTLVKTLDLQVHQQSEAHISTHLSFTPSR